MRPPLSVDEQECKAVRNVFGEDSVTLVNNTKSFIGHSMGAAGAIELQEIFHHSKMVLPITAVNLDNFDPSCHLPGLVVNEAVSKDGGINVILNNSFGMLGINPVLLLKSLQGKIVTYL